MNNNVSSIDQPQKAPAPAAAGKTGQAIAFINPSLSTRNVGDLFIESSVKRILCYDPQRSFEVDPRKPVDAGTISRINQCDAAVIVGTNLWYRDICHPGRWMLSADLLRQVQVPIVPFGVGTTRHKGEDNGFSDESMEILRLIHARCEVSSARDERTATALTEAGIKNVALTGCPTLFRSLNPDWVFRPLRQGRRIVVTVRKGQKTNVRRLLRLLRDGNWDVLIAAQQDKDTYFARTIPFIQKATPTLYRYDLEAYVRGTREYSGAIGWRLHGNMLHLAEGNPAVFFANCSRAESFCQTFKLPCVVAEDAEEIPEERIAACVAQLTDPSAFTAFPSQYRHFRAAMGAFLTANGLRHNL